MADQEAEFGALERIMGDASAEPTRLPYSLIKSITGGFSREIGRGGFGVVYLGDLPSGKVAVKKLSISQDFSDQLFQDEVHCLMRVKHNNIVRFLGYCSDTQGELMEHDGKKVMAEVRQRLLVFDYAPNGSLQLYLTEKTIEWTRQYQMIKGICHGLQYLHKERINHLDLKPENVLLDAHMEPKITDFGLSRWFHEGQSRIFTKSTPGKRGYIAPEIIDKGEISFKSDIFSFGVVFIKLLTGSDNYDFENWHKSIDVKSPQMECCIEIARKCVDTDQHKRPSIDEIIHKLNEMNSAEESRDDPGSSIHQVGGASTLEELPPSMPCVDNQEGEKVKRELNKMDPTPQGPAGLKMPPPLMQPVMQPSAQRMEDPYDHSDTSDDLFDDSDDDPECFCVDDPRRVSQQWRRHNGGLVDKARPANAGGGDQDRRTNLVKGEISPISRNQPSQGKMGNITSVPTVPNHRPMVGSVPTVPNHRPMVGNGMLPEQVMMRYPNTMDIGPWSVPFPLQGGHGGEGSALSGREVLQVAAVAQNSIALQQQQHMALMRQQQHHQHQQHMAFYLLLFLFLLLLTVIVIVIVILTFKKRG
ncbi:LEAF RUST 10 DISEASE-RESISTANCE LOCUS RECEPTOR-LIKE PROTEIN KINASE-like 2.8 [Triticum dicoccoides]|uniref:LEAF RUST 10 DISEASE-RESISTANCE LOCUS RECEPTOR-LIKE PROTEIN KINASE-like 2.8 n=1 Tax=Triticum dicoccoides TaxID=85692 RepID=UPI000E7BBA20|nr:LEAF RUST 10 DISEASE-RESISTANCE LOCUS RECEPTOR-LIKE PROTEIN KINASE-like 2.8 [Triticum dicoccoides]XP_037418579.1 LEAF RUST 10 DISEASE-RESISTANCE LOCUS RECEPTOR-LIKE PROTEIN KINASE-like 2.8 [Triticum dicoccoides]